MSSVSVPNNPPNQPNNSNSLYNVGDCIEFKRFIPSTSPDVFEYIVSNGKIISPPRHKAGYQKCFSFEPLGLCGSFSGLSGLGKIHLIMATTGEPNQDKNIYLT